MPTIAESLSEQSAAFLDHIKAIPLPRHTDVPDEEIAAEDCILYVKGDQLLISAEGN